MQRTILHLTRISGVGPATILQLYQAMEGRDMRLLYRYTTRDIQACGVSQNMAQAIVSGLRNHSLLDAELRAIERVGGSYITIADAQYPQYVWHTHTPPPVLYYQGASLDCLQRAVAFVGARDANAYARRSIERIVPGVVSHGYTIVSGGARGADALAHKAALQSGGSTVAVLGAGLAHPYPLQNTRLFHEIQEAGGLIVTPFAVDTKVQAHNFPVRNRIIAGIGYAVVVVQARERSGTKITASYALDAGRDVGAVPGRIDDPLSAGVHELIGNGARVITSAEDVVAMCGGALQPDASLNEKENRRHEEDPIVTLCHTPQQFDALLQETQLSFFDLQSRLMELQMAGKVAQDFSGCWYAC